MGVFRQPPSPSVVLRSKWLIFFLVAVGIFMSTLDGSIVNVALPTIMGDFETPLETVEWVVVIYLLTVSSLLLSFGRLSDIKGRRWVYATGLIVFSAGSFLCGLAASAHWLIGARAFQGVGAAMIMACTPALVVDTFPASERGRALGMMGPVVATGLMVGPALGGVLLHLFSWRVIFYINVPIGLATAALIAKWLRGSQADRKADESFDWTGSFLLTLSLVCLLIALTHGHSWGYGSAQTLLLLGASVLSIGAFVWLEARIGNPIVELALFSHRRFSLPVLSAVALFITLFSVIFLMPFYLTYPCGYAVKKMGLVMMTPFVFLFVLSPLSGALSDRLGSRGLCTLGMAVMATALFALASLSASSGTLDIVWRLGLTGVGTALFLPPNSSEALSAVPPNRRGIAAATVAMARNLGMVIGVAQAGAIFNGAFYTLSGGLSLKVYRPELAPIFITSFRYAVTSAGLVALLGAMLAFLRGSEKDEG